MLQVHTFDPEKTVPAPTNWAESRVGNRLDCETGALLRQVVLPLFAQAKTWAGLRELLSSRGYDLGFDNGRLVLIDTLRDVKICSCRYLGYPLETLAKRLGRLRARPPQGAAQFGIPAE